MLKEQEYSKLRAERWLNGDDRGGPQEELGSVVGGGINISVKYKIRKILNICMEKQTKNKEQNAYYLHQGKRNSQGQDLKSQRT